MAPLVIPSRLRPPPLPSRLHTPSPPSQLRPSSSPSQPRPPSSPLQLRPSSPPSQLRPPSPPSHLPQSPRSQLPPSPPPQLQLCSPPVPPPPPPVPLKAPSPPKPPDPPDSPALNLVPGFSNGVPLVYGDDTSVFPKRLSPAVCSVVFYWSVDWNPHRFTPISISGSLPLPLIQVLSQRFFISCDELISLVWYLKLSFDLSLVLALVHSFTAVCSPFTAVCSSFTAVCGSIFVVVKSFFAQWQLNGLMVSPFVGLVLFPISSSTLCGFGVGNILLKIRDTSITEVLIKGFVAMVKIVDCALVAASVSGVISLIVVANFQGFISLYSSMVAEIRGLLDIISWLSVLYTPIILCCFCFLVVVVCLACKASSSCMHTFSSHGD